MTALAELIRPGRRVALADGAGCPTGLLAELSTAARRAGTVELVLGWEVPGSLDGLDLGAFASVRWLMGDHAPFRYGALPALLAGPLRPDVLVASVSEGMPWFLTEVGWLRAAVDAGAIVAGVEREQLPVLDRGAIIPPEKVRIVGASDAPAAPVDWGTATDVERAVAERVGGLVPTAARLRYEPGPLGDAVVDALTRRTRIDTSVVSDAVMRLDQRGMLLGRPLASYVAGSAELYGWADGRADVDRIEVTHDPVRLAREAGALVSVTGAGQIAHDGQVAGDDPDAADHAAAASRSFSGLSVVAVPTSRDGRSTLVPSLSAPATVLGEDVDIVVTERGCADLRGLDRDGRQRSLRALWGE